jgi:hypothetical protein
MQAKHRNRPTAGILIGSMDLQDIHEQLGTSVWCWNIQLTLN